MTAPNLKDLRQRFFIDNSPIRGDVVSIEQTLTDMFEHQTEADYPSALKKLLGEMAVSASLLASTLKIDGRLSLQLQSTQANSCITWAMAECNHKGELRALAKINDGFDWTKLASADDILASLSTNNQSDSVLFINIEPEKGQRYQGIVERVSDNLAECICHYQEQSAQIPTLLSLASNGDVAGGIMVQQLPTTTEEEAENLDTDLWPRLTSLTHTLSAHELLNLPAQEILYRLYHEEEVRLPEATVLRFGCTCSHEKCLSALVQLGAKEVVHLYAEQPENDKVLNMDCHFCGKKYPITQKEALNLFELPN